VTVSEARALAARWVAEHAAGTPGFAGALLGGSVAWSPGHAELPATSDVDVMVVTDHPGAAPARSKRRYGGVLLEVTVLPWDQLRSPERVLAWLFPTGVTTHVLLTAGLRNPTVRLRYLSARTLLDDYGRPGFQQELLALLGCAELSRERVEWHLTAMTAAFDTAAAVAATPFPFSSDITPAARPVAVDGSRDLVGRDHHREAVFWIAVTYARCLATLASDAPAAAPGHLPGFSALLGDLGIASPADLGRRAGKVRGFLPRLGRVAEAILAANPDARD
jgi:hypothetical protein